MTHAKSLSGKAVTLPGEASAPTFVVAGFTKGSSDTTRAWWMKAGPLCLAHLQVRCYRVAVLEDVPGFIRGMVAGGIRRGIPESEQDSFLIVLENEQAWKKAVRYSAADDAYFFFADPGGRVLWSSHGGADISKADELDRAFRTYAAR